MKKLITVFTPTYNRAHLLPRLYKSLVEQTSMDFLWLIVDDGSSDETEDLVNSWIKENLIEIKYFYKKNGGMHTGHNLAYQNINTELNICIDSDDFMPQNAIELIKSVWESIPDKKDLAGIIGLDAFIDGSIVGSKIPNDLLKGSLIDLYRKHKVSGDKKVILCTEIVRQYPLYPEFDGERLVPLSVLYTMIGADYDFIYSNEVFCIVDYQADGSSGTIFRQYKQSPRGFAYAKIQDKKITNNFWIQLKNSMQIVSFAIFAKDISLINKGPMVYYNYLMVPLGVLYNLFIRLKIKQSR
ncbi:glycosyltransferase family 2 protein [Weeksellaceae bacterium KMM 9713]|uniref:Glycosyltransferase family 2 protein n=1 Tax=Profundicola chukchiensis TaxID=2961959 RepID=A0A9X4RTB7_9FLAO|nr:glycosyltransferase family A protein [Profundicola chukchiensis]MDG4944803.1 glycosyltransferase family 2 protein [Profundicola chukchiensis]